MKWSYFPRNQKIDDELLNVISVFEDKSDIICSDVNHLRSDDVLAAVADSLAQNGYLVERSKADSDKIKMPVLYGENSCVDLNFEVDAFNEEEGIVIEVEAGRAVTNYQFLKDFLRHVVCAMFSIYVLLSEKYTETVLIIKKFAIFLMRCTQAIDLKFRLKVF